MSMQGHLLIASPNEWDPDFVETVILLIQHSKQQAVGVVLNRPTAKTLQDLYSHACCNNQHIYAGGPVPGTLMAVHTREPLAELEILPGVYYAVRKRNLKRLVRKSDLLLRMFDGHAGWGPGQLEEQIERDGWKVAPATTEYVFHGGDDLWDSLAGLS